MSVYKELAMRTTCKSVCAIVGGLGACLALGAMLSGLGVIPRRTPTPRNPPKQQPSIIVPRTPGVTFIRIDGVNYRVSAQATRSIGGAPGPIDIPATNIVDVVLTLVRVDGRAIPGNLPIPSLVCTQGGVATNVPLQPIAYNTLVPERIDTRRYGGPGNVAWADDVLITGTVRVQGVRGLATSRIPVPMQVIALP